MDDKILVVFLLLLLPAMIFRTYLYGYLYSNREEKKSSEPVNADETKPETPPEPLEEAVTADDEASPAPETSGDTVPDVSPATPEYSFEAPSMFDSVVPPPSVKNQHESSDIKQRIIEGLVAGLFAIFAFGWFLNPFCDTIVPLLIGIFFLCLIPLYPVYKQYTPKILSFCKECLAKMARHFPQMQLDYSKDQSGNIQNQKKETFGTIMNNQFKQQPICSTDPYTKEKLHHDHEAKELRSALNLEDFNYSIDLNRYQFDLASTDRYQTSTAASQLSEKVEIKNAGALLERLVQSLQLLGFHGNSPEQIAHMLTDAIQSPQDSFLSQRTYRTAPPPMIADLPPEQYQKRAAQHLRYLAALAVDYNTAFAASTVEETVAKIEETARAIPR